MNEATRQIALRWFQEVWQQRRVASIHELLAPSALGHMEGQDIVGPEQFATIHREILQALPDLVMTIEDVVAEGENAVVRWSFRGRHTGCGLGCEPTLRDLSFGGMTWFKIRDGQIIEGWDRWNHAAFLRTLLPD